MKGVPFYVGLPGSLGGRPKVRLIDKSIKQDPGLKKKKKKRKIANQSKRKNRK